MGKGFNNYMCKKFFHPGSKENIKRVWMAQQKTEFEKKKQEDLTNQYLKEQEVYAHRALLGDEKAKLGLSFMYDAPPGTKSSREKEEGEPEFKFEWQGKFKAPREAYLKNDESIQDQPFGIEVRNVRCIKCHKWGHMNTDKICPLFKESLTAEPPQPKDNETDLMQDLEEDGLRLKQVVRGRKNNPGASNQQMVDSEDEDLESQFLKSLSDKQKKKLLKKIEKLQSKKSKKKKRSKESESGSEDEDKKADLKHHSSGKREPHYSESNHRDRSAESSRYRNDVKRNSSRHDDRHSPKMVHSEKNKSRRREDESGHRNHRNGRSRSRSPIKRKTYSPDSHRRRSHSSDSEGGYKHGSYKRKGDEMHHTKSATKHRNDSPDRRDRRRGQEDFERHNGSGYSPKKRDHPDNDHRRHKSRRSPSPKQRKGSRYDSESD